MCNSLPFPQYCKSNIVYTEFVIGLLYSTVNVHRIWFLFNGPASVEPWCLIFSPIVSAPCTSPLIPTSGSRRHNREMFNRETACGRARVLQCGACAPVDGSSSRIHVRFSKIQERIPLNLWDPGTCLDSPPPYLFLRELLLSAGPPTLHTDTATCGETQHSYSYNLQRHSRCWTTLDHNFISDAAHLPLAFPFFPSATDEDWSSG